jgi:hypothetical protein
MKASRMVSLLLKDADMGTWQLQVMATEKRPAASGVTKVTILTFIFTLLATLPTHSTKHTSAKK